MTDVTLKFLKQILVHTLSSLKIVTTTDP